MSTNISKGRTNQGFFKRVGGVDSSTSPGSLTVTRMWGMAFAFFSNSGALSAGTQPTKKK